MPEDQLRFHSNSLVSYCNGALSLHRDHWPPTEDALAEHFLACFPISSIPTQKDLEHVGSALGIKVSFRSLPPGLTGHNSAYGARKEIVLSEKEVFPGVMTHSFFHEMREVIEGVFIDLGFPTEPGEKLEERAEHFAQLIRINSAIKEFGGTFEQFNNIDSKWRRWGAVFVVLVLAVGHYAGCILLPYFEDRLAQRDRDSE